MVMSFNRLCLFLSRGWRDACGCRRRASYGDGWTAAHDAADRASDHRHDDAAVRETRRAAGVSLRQGRRTGHGGDERQGCAANLRARHMPTISASMSRADPRSAGRETPNEGQARCAHRRGERGSEREAPDEGQTRCGEKPRGARRSPLTRAASMLRRNVAGSVERTAPGSGPAKTGASKAAAPWRLGPGGQAVRWRPRVGEGLRRRSLQKSRKQACAAAVASGWASLRHPAFSVSRNPNRSWAGLLAG